VIDFLLSRLGGGEPSEFARKCAEEYVNGKGTSHTSDYRIPKTAVLPESPGSSPDKIQAFVRDAVFNQQTPYFSPGIRSSNSNLSNKWMIEER